MLNQLWMRFWRKSKRNPTPGKWDQLNNLFSVVLVTHSGPWSTNDDGAFFKAALLSGPPGIGIYITYLKIRFILKLTFLPCARLWRPASSSRMACETSHYPDLENVMTFESRDVRALCAWEDFGEGVSDNEECLGVRPAKS